MGKEDFLIKQRDAVERSFREYSENKSKGPSLKGADTGIHDMNMMLGGHVPGKLTTIAGRSGHGKTASTIPMFKASERVVSGKIPAYIFFTWEMASEEVVGRYISHESGLDWRRIYQLPWVLTQADHDRINAAYDRARVLPILYQEMSTNINMVWDHCGKFSDICKAKTKESGVEHVPVAIIDYIGMAKFDGSKDLRTYRIADFMNSAKTMSKECKQHTIALAQINRGADEKALPDRSDLSDSQAIEQASDNLIILHRPEYVGKATIQLNGEEVSSKDKVVFRYLKGRSTGTGDRILNCEAKLSRFWSLEHEHDFEYWKMYEDMDFWKTNFGS